MFVISSPSVYFGYYRTGRFVFALSLLISFQMAGLLTVVPRLFYILAIFSLVAFVRLMMSERLIGHFDFILDIIFISAIVYVSFGVYSYMTLFYLFPIFFSSLYISGRQILLYPFLATMLYGAIFILKGAFFYTESLFNISLHALSFSLIAFAATHLNQRMARQERYIKSLEEDRIRMLGYERLYRVSADLAHELRNPLAAISAAVQFMKEGKSSPDFINMLDSETSRLTNLVNDFLMFSRPSDAPKEDVDLCEMLRTIKERNGQGIEISLDMENSVIVRANRIYLDAALNNIVRNATEAAKTSILVTLRQTDKSALSGGEIRFEVEDDGPGIEESMRERIFEPFVTTKKMGTGLGLALAYRVISSLGGNIVAGVSQFGGARITVVLPSAGEIHTIMEAGR
jgi:signal transduction histidine kinase